jgi:hypothetical protein
VAIIAPVEPRALGDLAQGGGVADIAPVDEIGPEQRQRDRGLPPLHPRPVDQAVGIDRVGGPFDPVEVQRQARALGMFHHRRIGRERALPPAELVLEILAAVHAALGISGFS